MTLELVAYIFGALVIWTIAAFPLAMLIGKSIKFANGDQEDDK